MAILDSLEKAAFARGLHVVDRGQGHLQIAGGPLLVNYYPLAKKRSAYVAGTTSRVVNVTPEHAVEMAFLPPAIKCLPERVQRRGNYRNKRRRMLKSNSLCHWCKKKLTLDNSTLDHAIPLARGGLDNANNWVLACETCNHDRGHAMPELRNA